MYVCVTGMAQYTGSNLKGFPCPQGRESDMNFPRLFLNVPPECFTFHESSLPTKRYPVLTPKRFPNGCSLFPAFLYVGPLSQQVST